MLNPATGILKELFPNIPGQFWTIVFGTIITIAFVFYTYFKIKRQDPKIAPTGLALLTTNYVNWFGNFMDKALGGKLRHVHSYLFTIFNYILIMSLLSLVGFEAAPSAYYFPFVLALISFIGIYVIGIGTKGLLQFSKEKYSNPINIFGQVAPLLSLSLRLFGATLAGAVLGQILLIILTSLSDASWLKMWPMFSGFIKWGWQFIESALTFIQAFVFMFLTSMYWLMEVGPSWNKKDRQTYYKEQKRMKNEKN